MSPSEYLEYFRYQLALLPTKEESREGFEDYLREIAELRSETIRELRIQGVPGYVRARCNNLVDYLIPDWNLYQYRISKNCRICGWPIYDLRDITSDHIICLGDGGSNTIDNQQIAHADCNIMKDADFNKRTKRQ